jgi:hypothetical protein
LVKEKNPIGFDRKKISVQKGKNPKNPQLCRLKTRPNEELERNGLLQSISHARASVLRRNFFLKNSDLGPLSTRPPPDHTWTGRQFFSVNMQLAETKRMDAELSAASARLTEKNAKNRE